MPGISRWHNSNILIRHNMENNSLKRYDRVEVSPELTGLGKPLYGWISDIKEFFGQTLYSIKYDLPDEFGCTGIETSNPGMLKPLKTRE